jgi:lipoyl(octanoyl) transferase
MSIPVHFLDWGLIDYKLAWDQQEALFKEKADIKLAARQANESLAPQIPHHLVFCQHPHVFTLGKSGDANNLLLGEDELDKANASYYPINRGGDITYHGPGQLVGYPILDLEQIFTDIHKYLRYLEEAIIQLLVEYGIEATRYEGLTGVWIDADKPQARKICAMGVRCSRWITMHGFALNVNTDLSYFKHIIPCGIDDKAVTSMEKELGYALDLEEVSEKLKQKIAAQFGFTYV